MQQHLPLSDAWEQANTEAGKPDELALLYTHGVIAKQIGAITHVHITVNSPSRF